MAAVLYVASMLRLWLLPRGLGPLGIGAVGACCLLVGCATGVTETGGPLETGAGGEITGVGAGGNGGAPQATVGSGNSPTGPAGPGAGGGMGGDMGAGGGTTSGGGMMSMCDFTHQNTCTSAMGLQSVAGDESSPVQTVMGDSSGWFLIEVQERSGSIIESDLSYTVTLTSPPGMDYDVIVYQGPQDGPPDCNATPRVGVGAGSVETVHDSWDDDQGFGGEDDDVWLSIEVRHVSGTDCGAQAQWTLSIQGNT